MECTETQFVGRRERQVFDSAPTRPIPILWSMNAIRRLRARTGGLVLVGVLASPAAGESSKLSQQTRQHRIDVDINGDGRAEILLAREFVGAKAGDSFEVLSPARDGTLRSWGHLEFNPGIGFRVDRAHKRLLVISPMAASEITLIEHELKPGLRVLSARSLQQWGDTGAAYEQEQRALKRYWSQAKLIETYAEAGDSIEAVWLGVRTGRPVSGLRRLDGKGWTKAPPQPPGSR